MFSDVGIQDLHKELKKNVLQLQARCRSGKSNKSIANNFAGNTVHEDAQTRSKYMVPWLNSRALYSGIAALRTCRSQISVVPLAASCRSEWMCSRTRATPVGAP